MGILQALKVGGKAKVGGSVKLGGKAKVGGKAKIGGKAKLGLKVGGKASLKVKAPKVKGGGKASLKVGGKAKAGGKGGLKLKAGGKAGVKGGLKFGGKAKAGGKVHIKLGGGFKLKAKAGYKVISGFENKTSPKLFLKGTTCKASFDKACTSLYAVNHERKVVQAYGKKCFMALVRIRGELSCAVCDNKMEKFFADPSKMSIKEGDLNHLGVCVQFMAKFNTYKSLLSDMLSFAKSMG